MRRYLSKVSSSAIFFWFTSGTAVAQRGAAMLYRSQSGLHSSRYVAFGKTDEWKPTKVSGISSQELEWLMKSEESPLPS